MSMIFICVGFLLYKEILGPGSNSEKIIDMINRIDSVKVNSIKICRTRLDTGTYVSLVQKDIIIKDRKIINELCYDLNQAKTNFESEKNAEWVCRMEIEFKNGTIIPFGLCSQYHTIELNVLSDGEDGWVYGGMQADMFGYRIKKYADSINGK